MTYNEMWRRLAQRYDEGEAKAIARLVYEKRTGLSLADICLGKDTQLSANSQAELAEIARRLETDEPVQYVLGTADFCGRTFEVDSHVLIPRPETEELCQWVVETANRTVETEDRVMDTAEKGQEAGHPTLLDIGTGSGCIAVTLAATLPGACTMAWDISAEALEVARRNADRHGVAVRFAQVDILNVATAIQSTPQPLDIIVSNPPYILNKERASMAANVMEYEPHQALFVPDDNPLLFYRAIAQYGMATLRTGGSLFFEINPACADDLRSMLCEMSYHGIETRTDAYGKQRMLKARR